MSASIGAFTFIEMTGVQLSSIADRVIMIDRPGVDGIGSQTPAKKSASAEKRTVEGYTALVNANAAKAAYEAMKGTYVTVVNPMGATTLNVLIVNVRGVQVRSVGVCTDPAVNYIVEAVWEMRESE